MTVRRSMAYVGVVALILAPVSWLWRLAIDGREAARSSQCVSNLKQIGFALQNYESIYGCFPPAYVADAKGKPLYSWRVLLMAAADDGGKFRKSFRFDEPWDSPNNRKLEHLHPSTWWQCPSHLSRGSTDTHFVAVVGPGTIFPSDGTSRRSADVTDRIDKTLMVVEIAGASIHWMEPKDLDWNTMSFQLNDRARPSISSHHFSTNSRHFNPHATTVDNRVETLQRDLPPEILKARLTISGGETIPPEWDLSRYW